MTIEPTTTSPGGDRLADGGTRVRYGLMDLAAEMGDVIALGRGDPDLPTHCTSSRRPRRRSTAATRTG